MQNDYITSVVLSFATHSKGIFQPATAAADDNAVCLHIYRESFLVKIIYKNLWRLHIQNASVMLLYYACKNKSERKSMHIMVLITKAHTGTVTYSRRASNSLTKCLRFCVLRYRHHLAHFIHANIPTRIRIITPATADVCINCWYRNPLCQRKSKVSASWKGQRT